MAHNSTAYRMTVRGVSGEKELHQADTLMASARHKESASAVTRSNARGTEYPLFREEHTRIALWNNELAGALRLHTETIRLGEARLRMGGLGLMTTAPSFQRRGVSGILMRDALEYLRDKQFHVAVVFGLPGFFHRFGFAPVLAEYAVIIDTLEMPSPGPVRLKHRSLKPGDLAAIQKIHSMNSSRLPCSVVRSAAHFANQWDRAKSARVCTNHQGKVVGYYFLRSTHECLEVEEVGAEGPEVIQDILAVCLEASHLNGSGRVRFHVPPDLPFAQYLTQFDSRHEMHVSVQEGGMMAFVDVNEALESMVPEWENKLFHSLLRDERCEITLVVEGAPFRIRANRGAIDVSPGMGGSQLSIVKADLVQLVTGSCYVHDVIEQFRRFLPPVSRDFLATLFPKRNPYLPILDRF